MLFARPLDYIGRLVLVAQEKRRRPASTTVTRRCCADPELAHTISTVGTITCRSVRGRPPELGQPVQDVARESGFRLLSRPTARSKTIANDRLVPEERVLHAGLLVVSGSLLPPSPTENAHPPDRAIATRRKGPPARQRRGLGRRPPPARLGHRPRRRSRGCRRPRRSSPRTNAGVDAIFRSGSSLTNRGPNAGYAPAAHWRACVQRCHGSHRRRRARRIDLTP